jgi:hypothetical protein
MELNERVYLFAKDQATIADVKEYMHNYLSERILSLAFNKQDITGYAEAKEVIDSCFTNMIAKASGNTKTTFINENE